MLCGNYILSNRSEWTFYFLSSVQFNFTIGEKFPLFISGELIVTELKKDKNTPMRNRYSVIKQREMTNLEINKIYSYFVNPVNWR